ALNLCRWGCLVFPASHSAKLVPTYKTLINQTYRFKARQEKRQSGKALPPMGNQTATRAGCLPPGRSAPGSARPKRKREAMGLPLLPAACCLLLPGLLGLVDDAGAALHHLVLFRQAIERLGGPEKQIASRFERGVDAR